MKKLADYYVLAEKCFAEATIVHTCRNPTKKHSVWSKSDGGESKILSRIKVSNLRICFFLENVSTK